jgi:mRNA-degrading endonuclease YafQ of YafQ-DinJ toxin-antitoxin module
MAFKKDLTANIKKGNLHKSKIKKILKNLNFNDNSRRTSKKIKKTPLLYSKGFD